MVTVRESKVGKCLNILNRILVLHVFSMFNLPYSKLHKQIKMFLVK